MADWGLQVVRIQPRQGFLAAVCNGVRPFSNACSPPANPLAPSLPAFPRPACRGCLRIGYQIDGGQLQGRVEVACRTDETQALTTLGWAGRLDDVSRRVLAQALRHAAHPDPPARLAVFAAAARDVFRHAVQTLPLNPGNRTHPCARHRLSNAAIPEADSEPPPPPVNLLAAICALRIAVRFRPRVTLTDSAAN